MNLPKTKAKLSEEARNNLKNNALFLANTAFVTGHMYDAIANYSLALDLNPYDVEVLSNRAIAYTKVRAFEKAVDDLKKVLREEGKPILKTLIRLCKAYWGMRHYDQIIRLFETLIATGEWHKGKPEEEKLFELLETTKRMRQESKDGKYDMQQLIQKQKQVYDCGEYQGLIAMKGIAGKGMGFVATSNIAAGSTLLATKAFAIAFPSSDNMEFDPSKPEAIFQNHRDSSSSNNNNPEDFDVNKAKHKLVQIIKDILRSNPVAAKDFYALFAGNELGRIYNFVESKENPLIDEERISKICDLNAWYSASNPNPSIIPPAELVDEIRNHNTYGLWLLPSFVNHSCVNINCDIQKYGDLLIMRATKIIKKGDEILCSYIQPTRLYNERIRELGHFEFICQCQLCQIEMKETIENHMRRTELQQAFLVVQKADRGQIDYPEVVKEIIQEMSSVNKNIPEQLQLCLLWMYRQLSFYYIGQKVLVLGVKYMQKAYSLAKKTSLAREGIRFAIQIAFCNFHLRDLNMTKKWLTILAKDVMLLYGTTDVLPALMLRENYDNHAMVKLLCQCLSIDEISKNVGETSSSTSLELSEMLNQLTMLV